MTYSEFVAPRRCVKVLVRRKRMAKKVVKDPVRYLNEEGRKLYTAYLTNKYLRVRMREESVARRLFVL